MQPVKKSMIRSNAAQIRHLVNYMAAHNQFAAGEYMGALGATQHEQQWLRLKAQLGELGPDRSVQQWKICWRDQKKKARAEGGAVKKVRDLTGNCAIVPNISENSEIILGTIGHAMAIGVGPEESPIGQSMPQPQPSPGPATAAAGSGTGDSPPPAPAVPMPTPRAATSNNIDSIHPWASVVVQYVDNEEVDILQDSENSLEANIHMLPPHLSSRSPASAARSSVSARGSATVRGSLAARGFFASATNFSRPASRQSLPQPQPSPGPATAAAGSGTGDSPPPAPAVPMPTPRAATSNTNRRARRVLPSDRFLAAQLESNELLKKVIEEMKIKNNEARTSNILKRENLRLQRIKLRLMRRDYRRRYMTDNQ